MIVFLWKDSSTCSVDADAPPEHLFWFIAGSYVKSLGVWFFFFFIKYAAFN